MTRLLILIATSVTCLATVSFLHRTDRLPRFLHHNIDMVSIALGVFAATPMSIAVWQWFGPIPQDLFSWNMAAYIGFNGLSQFLGIQLTRHAGGLSARKGA
ncbi:hypothetical protein C8J35_11440 [Rhizobium sp. PP-F2F-G38]|uniref:hypothetical protein n=1 Tax=Rhizobium sp. PP-CC-3G-465 TaxID=2135648 RepID=UPI000D8B23BF|nr:hypothetical protein C8J37_11536 [Rhizobium sp. PP-WC-1G-195]PYE93318.1 hypothetical protein C8J35_11440 [Rhizobium sp. PP-F2F-G38]TCP75330.1 hypothetical protein C8J31_1337 [Rhizobium sp. PP-CC-2G-626]TCQ02555.1 hypothetical protein C8J34_11726 [Rhizobium sp. PP-F2F-G36]TCQ17228.1 hypothetical protein C8J33_11325 [Rhizobium sp. PP-CC-3G-465]